MDDGILRLFVAEDEEAHDGPDGARGGQQFQEKTLFSEYDDFDTLRSLIEKSRAELFTRLLNEQIPYHARVAEVGCGSGQLTNFLAIAQRTVAGVDSNIDALRVAQRFKIAHQLERAAFAHVNLLQPGLREDFFDFVISLGVLDRTSHPREVFGRIARLVRSDGYFVIGLSKRRSRILQAGRQALARFAGNRRWQGDRRLGGLGDQEQRGQSWVRDRTSHPRESTHTLEQVLRWIEQDGFRFINMIPKPGFGDRLRVGDALFNPQPCRTRAERFLAQTGDWVNEGPEGGHVIVIAQRTDRVE
ncbi:MAG TPA: methyltransferase domain-containing protein [Thermoanaerobaculia bacterium]|nr:methyltransferase domain-containing protein [Thermoanaerobaculia bacterium]